MSKDYIGYREDCLINKLVMMRKPLYYQILNELNILFKTIYLTNILLIFNH